MKTEVFFCMGIIRYAVVARRMEADSPQQGGTTRRGLAAYSLALSEGPRQAKGARQKNDESGHGNLTAILWLIFYEK